MAFPNTYIHTITYYNAISEHTKTRVDRLIASINITSLLNDAVFKRIEECGKYGVYESI